MTVSSERLANVFVEIADTLVAEFDLIEFLQLVTARTAEIVSSDAAGLLLADNTNTLQFMAASDENTELLELFQVQHAQGPCLDCFNAGEAVVNAELTEASDRWPVFAPRAVEAGFRSVHAIPLRLRSATIGALNLFDTSPGRLRDDDVHLVQALADVATIGLLQERTIRRAEVLSEQLQTALNSRIVVEQAKGAVAQFHNVDVDRAFELMRGYARSKQRRISELAQSLLDDPNSIRQLR